MTSSGDRRGLAFLRTLQQPDGGFAYDANTEGSDTNSTAYALMAIFAAGQDPGSLEWSAGGDSGLLPVNALASLEEGVFEWQARDRQQPGGDAAGDPGTAGALLPDRRAPGGAVRTLAACALALLASPARPALAQEPGRAGGDRARRGRRNDSLRRV